MNWFETVSNTFSGALQEHEKGGLASALSSALQRTELGGLGGLVAKLQQSGLADEVESWLSNNPNLPVSVEQLRAALGNEQVQQIARSMGIPIDKVLPLLARHLPDAVDHSSPNGTLDEPAKNDTPPDAGPANSTPA